jgi:hypothetical protein
VPRSGPLAGSLYRAPLGILAWDLGALCRILPAGANGQHFLLTPTAGGKKSMSSQALDELKQQIPLLNYLQAHDWQPTRQLSRGRLMGLCPLHCDHKPSFLVDPSKSLFYCYGFPNSDASHHPSHHPEFASPPATGGSTRRNSVNSNRPTRTKPISAKDWRGSSTKVAWIRTCLSASSSRY